FALSRGENWRMRNHDVPGFIRKFLLFVVWRAGDARRAFLCATLLAASSAATLAQSPQGGATFPVGIRELEYIDPHEGGRHLALSVFYPAAIRERPAAPFAMPSFTKLNLYKDVSPAFGTSKHPLVMFSHGRGRLRLVRRVSGCARLHRVRTQPLPRQHLRLDDCLP